MKEINEVVMKLTFVLYLAILLPMRFSNADQEITETAQERVETQKYISVLKDKQNFSERPTSVADAIIKLGQLRAVEAIPFLIEHIELCDSRGDVPSRGSSIENCRIAVVALVRIGKASLQPVLEASKKEGNRLRLICMAMVIRELEGKKKAQELLELHITQSVDPKVIDRLQRIKAFIVSPPIY